ncbi:proteasome endopeptidase complex, beta subunit [Tilletiaria anomala UBC 951]|uniref:Proteasome subunit beta n=1 Tax=Tilletiaria anomala (strain ATCC 24038 / CBS 436.72 / UBC 951) TaxID=1037660 RepID=A0A066W3B8_TILAU|nr:proteasome endopeptidase complex, beta subunit [Tilletiaria anomala UBC 951]KDN48437.1 proteasome endopeptidase complex, beta subunit [Tilletiaria anomala UBC 951]
MAASSHFPGQTWSSQPCVDHVAQGFSSRPAAQDAFEAGRQHTQQPIVTGTSILGIRYKDGVMMAADTLASYGSLARFMDVRRLHEVSPNTLLGASGDMSDFQFIQHELQKVMIRESNAADGHTLSPSQVYAYLSRYMYQRRSKVDPLWNSFVVGGIDQSTGAPFLGYVDLLGTTYESTTIATGFGLHLAQPLLRKAVEGREDELDESQARRILEDCMKVLFYRDARSINRFQIATINNAGISISEPFSAPTSWGFAEGLRGYGPQTQ